MNKEETQQAIRVMQAWVDGEEEVEFESRSGSWQPIGRVSIWEFGTTKYRIKQKPREFWINIYPDPSAVGPRRAVLAHQSRQDANATAAPRRTDCIRVQEILGER